MREIYLIICDCKPIKLLHQGLQWIVSHHWVDGLKNEKISLRNFFEDFFSFYGCISPHFVNIYIKKKKHLKEYNKLQPQLRFDWRYWVTDETLTSLLLVTLCAFTLQNIMQWCKCFLFLQVLTTLKIYPVFTSCKVPTPSPHILNP